MNTARFFRLRNLATDDVTPIEKPWEFTVDPVILSLPKEQYKARWRNPGTDHCLLLMASGHHPDSCVTVGNQASMLYGFMADYDGVFTEDLIETVSKRPQSRWIPAYWCRSQGGKLHMFWFFERPFPVTGNAHANDLLKAVARKVKAAKWGVGYDPSCESVLQVMDVGYDWHVFREGAVIPAEDLVMWDTALFEQSVRHMIDDVVDIPFDIVAAEIKARNWPHKPPVDIRPGVRCVRFWDASADNTTAAQFVKDGVRVYTPHDNGFKSWRSLLGAEFCEAYTARSTAPFFEDTTYVHTKDEYWRFFRSDSLPHYERRTEKVLRRDLAKEARLSPKPEKGESLSDIDQALYTISRKNAVDFVAPILYRKSGRIHVDGLGSVLNTSLVVVAKPAERVATVTAEEAASEHGCPRIYKEDPSVCAWDNPFAVRGFPHIHGLLTAFFMSSQSRYDKWVADGSPLHDASGRTFSFLKDRQLYFLLSWMAHFYRNAAKMSRNPGRGQALILAGPAGTGKSFFGRQLLAQLMGGAVDAEKFYLEGSRFNSGIVSSPVHLIDDKLGAKSQRTRLQFTESLKIVVANAVLRYEAKFGSAVESVPWPGRVVVLSNEDAQSLSVMPDLDMSTRDKFMMLKLGGVRYNWGTDVENQKWLAEELPRFARFLLGWDIPLGMRDDRFGVRAIQHTDMAQASAENGLTQVLVEVLETCIEHVTGQRDPAADSGDSEGYVIEGNAVKIFKWITSVDPSFGREVIDSRTLQQNLTTLYRNGSYNLVLDESTKRWKIPYVLRRAV